MSVPGGFRGSGSRGSSSAPKGYVAGIGRGAAGFTTRSDIGNMATSSNGPTGEDGGEGGPIGPGAAAGSGSRASELRAAKLQAQKMQQQQQQQQKSSGGLFGVAPKGYVPGAGRGASAMGAGVGGGNNEGGNNNEGGPTGGGGGYNNNDMQGTVEGQYDDDDNEADEIWNAIDERMQERRKKKKRRTVGPEESDDPGANSRARIGAQFRELKEQLAEVSEEDWMKIPDVGDHSLKYKKSQQNRQDTFTPLSDSLLEQRHLQNAQSTQVVAGNTTAIDAGGGSSTTLANMSGLGKARDKVLGMSLDKMSDSVGGQTNVDPQGYLTSLASSQISTANNAQVGDIVKARLLLKSVRDTNPKHGPGWIASARVEEAAGKLLKARKLIQEGCEVCPDQEDVWLEAARLHPPQVAKSVLATAVRRIPHSVKLFLKAADLEHNEQAKKQVLRKALEANPTSITLWKAAIDLEDNDEDVKVLLSVAVEKVPLATDLWLALARIETYENACKVLNKARRALPSERSIWIAAAKLEESQHHTELVDKIMDRAFKSLQKNDAVVTRAQWLSEAEAAESSGAPLTSGAIIRNAIGFGVDAEDRQRTWADDAKGALARGSIATARAIIAFALKSFPTKRALWMQAVELERNNGTPESLDDVLKAASERLPRVELFWLLRAKEKWLAKDVDTARDILTQAFAANPDSEAVWLAAAKLEWETGEQERARVLLQRARERAPTQRVYMKSALLEREYGRYADALELIDEGITTYPKFPKLYMMGGQICSEDLVKQKSNLEKARKVYQAGLTECPNSIVLWILASRLEESAHTFLGNETTKAGVGVTKARSLLELARLKNPKTPELWLEAVRLERRNGNPKLADTLMARALQECPNSGILLAEDIEQAPKVGKKAKSTVAIQRCPESPFVIAAVASFFASKRQIDKARKWLERAVVLNPDIGDFWGRYLAFEVQHGTKEQQQSVKDRCVKAEPKHGEIWQSVMKDMSNRHKSIEEGLMLVVERINKES